MISSKSKIKYRKKTQKKNKKKGGTPKGQTFIVGKPNVNPHPSGHNRRQGYARLPNKSTPSPRNLRPPPPARSNLTGKRSPNFSPSSPPPGSSEWSHNVLTNSDLPTTFITIPNQKKKLVKPIAKRVIPQPSIPSRPIDNSHPESKTNLKNIKRKERRIAAYKLQNQTNMPVETSHNTNNPNENLGLVNLPPANLDSEYFPTANLPTANLPTANLSSSNISPSRKKSTRTLAALAALGIAGGIGANHYYNNSKSPQLSQNLPNVTPTRDIPSYLYPNLYDNTQPMPAGPPPSIDMYPSPNNYGGKNKKSRRKNKIRKRKTKKFIYRKKNIRKR